uniref:Uncharacterized protein n=1 Tax=Rhipicephalus appendiculatus TaxID=34631 RepID=A0A131YGJ8_RHIAP
MTKVPSFGNFVFLASLIFLLSAIQHGGQSCANAAPTPSCIGPSCFRGLTNLIRGLPGPRQLPRPGQYPPASSSGSSSGANGCCGFSSRGRRGAMDGVPIYRPHPAPDSMTNQQLKSHQYAPRTGRGFSDGITHPGGPRRNRPISQPPPPRPHQERQPAYSRIL